jgi:hypothetical protein
MSGMTDHRMLVVDRNRGLVEVELPSPSARSLIGSHHSAISRYLETGDDQRLGDLRGRSILTKEGKLYELETNPEAIEQLALAGDLGYEDIYVLE